MEGSALYRTAKRFQVSWAFYGKQSHKVNDMKQDCICMRQLVQLLRIRRCGAAKMLRHAYNIGQRSYAAITRLMFRSFDVNAQAIEGNGETLD